MDAASGNQGLDESWQRDSAAFADLVRRWQQPLSRFLTGLVGRTDLVPDLCQEVFLRVFMARSRYQETGAFSSWLYRIALNVARDACRRRRLQPQPLPNHALKVGATPVEARCERQELSDVIAAGLAELPLPVRQVVVLRHYEGMNFKEIAQLLGVPPSTLRCRFEVGMRRLRDFLRQRGWAD